MTVHDSVSQVQILQATQDGFRNLSQDVDAYRAKVLGYAVERSTRWSVSVSSGLELVRGSLYIPDIHVLHAHYHIPGRILEGTVKVDNVIRVAVVHDSEFSHDSFPHFVLRFDMYDLPLSVFSLVSALLASY